MKTEGAGPRRNQEGVSLLEVIIAVIIISIAASIYMVSSRTSVTGQIRSKVYGEAATATKEALELIQIWPLDSLKTLNNSPIPHNQGAGVEVRATSRGVRASDVRDISILDTTTLRHVTLVTRFKSKAGGKVAKSFSTIVFKP